MALSTRSTTPFYQTKITTIVLLYIVTLGLYEHYWHYKNWKIIQNNSGDLSISPILRGFFYPFFILSLISVIRGSTEVFEVKPGAARTWFGVLYIATWFISWHLSNDIYIFVFVFGVLLIFFLQKKASELNHIYCERYDISRDARISVEPSRKHSKGSRLPSGNQFDYQSFLLPHKYTIELSAFVVVLVVCTSLALHDSQRAFAKAKLSEVLISVTAAKAEIGEVYALTGQWWDQSLDHVRDEYGSSIIDSISTSSDGGIHYKLNGEATFIEDNELSFPIKQDDYSGPMHINRWDCNAQQSETINKTTVSIDFLPSVCRG